MTQANVTPIPQTADNGWRERAFTRVKLPTSRNVLLEFRHGLGDAVQLTVVLNHLAEFFPDWHVDVVSLVGKHSVFDGQCRRTSAFQHRNVVCSDYDHVIDLHWPECAKSFARWPSTKPVRCLREVFRLTPVTDLCRYSIAISDESRARAREYLSSICSKGAARDDGRFPVVVLHYQGNSSPGRKNLTHELARDVCDAILAEGCVPVILDWDNRTPLADGTRIHNPDAKHPLWGQTGTGDAEIIAALIEASSLMVGVDSGPLHVAGATSTPTIGVWLQQHPVRFFDLADNVLHLVPKGHEEFCPGSEAAGFFKSNYRHHIYRRVQADLPELVAHYLRGNSFDQLASKAFLRQLRATSYAEDYYLEHKEAGLDYLAYGNWQQAYGRWLVQSLGWQGQRLLDVGCACGSIVRGLREAGALAGGVDVNEHMVQLGRNASSELRPHLHICDAVNLHLFRDGSWDGIHSSQVAEHWRPEHVRLILRELRRVATPGALFFCELDTEDLFARQGRDLAQEDPTHICIRPLEWWHDQLQAAGWELCGEDLKQRMRSHPESYLSRYDWDWWIARAV